MIHKGIILAGGSGSRLRPLTDVVCKQLLPVYDKPMIYYPLSTLMMMGLRDILIISTPKDLPTIESLLGDGSDLGIKLHYKVQTEPRGLADAFRVGADFVGSDPVCLILGDNLIHVAHITELMRECVNLESGAYIVGTPVADPRRFGVIELDEQGNVVGLTEKPAEPKSNIAAIGLYFYDGSVVEKARGLAPSARGELEITDLSKLYLAEGQVRLKLLSRGDTWLDMGTFDSLGEAAQYLQTAEARQGLKVGCIEEVAYMMGYIDAAQLTRLGERMGNSPYGAYLIKSAATEKNRKVA